MNQVNIQVEAWPGAEPDDVAGLTQRLRSELLELEVDAVAHPKGQDAPRGAKGAEVTSITSLVVSLAPIVVPALVRTVQSWLQRHDRVSLTLEKEGEKIRINGKPSKEQQQIIGAWLRRQHPN